MTRSLALAVLAATALAGTNAQAQFGNPIVDRDHSSSYRYDPFSDTHFVDNHRRTIRESAFDLDRGHIDDGSYRYVDRIVFDEFGRRVREYGYVWTSYGKPHGRLTREVITVNHRPDPFCRPGFGGPGREVRRDRDTVIFSRPQPGREVRRDRDTVIFSQPQPGRQVERNRDTVIFSQPQSNSRRSTQRNLNNLIRGLSGRR